MGAESAQMTLKSSNLLKQNRCQDQAPPLHIRFVGPELSAPLLCKPHTPIAEVFSGLLSGKSFPVNGTRRSSLGFQSKPSYSIPFKLSASCKHSLVIK